MKTKFTFMLALLAFHSSLSFGQTSAVPGTISYQGTVYNPDGSLLGGGGTPVNRTVIFRIWDSSSATTAANLLYSESQTVTISEGNFSVLVGNGIPNGTPTYGYSETSKHSSASPAVSLADVFNGAARYLSVTVANASAISATDAEISPRQQIVSSAFAFRSKFAEALGTSASGRSLQVLDNGNIGVGNASPPSALTVTGANSSYAAPQLLLTATDTTERLRLGVNDTGNGTGFIQAWKEGSGSQNLTLNSEGGNVGIGNRNPTNQLSVTGAADFSGNVGIGVTSPLAKLHVNGTASFRTGMASDGYLSITPGTSSTAGYLSWYKPGGLRQGALGGEGNNVRLNLENSADFTVLGGNVGIGTTSISSATSKLTLQGDMTKSPADQLTIRGNANTEKRLLVGYDTTANKASLQSYTATSTTGQLLLNPNGGNVGIGVTAPGNPLTIQSTVGSNDASSSQHNLQLQIQNGRGAKSLGIGVLNDGTAVLQAKEVNVGYGDILINPTGGRVAIQTTNTTQGDLSVGLAGVVSVGSRGGSNGYAKMRYVGDGSGMVFDVYNALNNGLGWRSFKFDGDSNLDFYSDRRLKKDIVFAEPMLDRLMQLPFRRFRWKDNTAADQKHEFGVIAQEVQPLFPDLVSQGEDGIMTVGYTTFATIACKSIQELNEKMEDKIAQLETKLSEKEEEAAALEARLSALEKLVNSSQ
jgi:hypothetical protein